MLHGHALTAACCLLLLLNSALGKSKVRPLDPPRPVQNGTFPLVYKAYDKDGFVVTSWRLKNFQDMYPVTVYYKDKEDALHVYKMPHVEIELEEPNRLIQRLARSWTDHDLKQWVQSYQGCVLTVCPYTAEWLNWATGRVARGSVFLAVDPVYTNTYVPLAERLWDIAYVGSATAPPVIRAMSHVFTRCKYVWLRKQGRPEKWAEGKLQVKKNMPFFKKMQLLSQSKMALVHNTLGFSPGQVLEYPCLQNHPAFANFFNATRLAYWRSRFDKWIPTPQAKGRLFESAAAGSLMLVWRDAHRLVERWFVPGDDFLYWDTEADLQEIVNAVLANPSQYDHIARSAQAKMRERYTPEILMRTVIMPFINHSCLWTLSTNHSTSAG